MLNNKYDDMEENYKSEHQNINGKFEFEFGIIWTVSFIFIAIVNLISSNGNAGALMFIIFIGAGILFIHTGAKKIKADKNTEAFGEECYGKVYKLSKNGEVNGKSLYEARVIVYIPSENSVKIISEAIGYDYSKFPENSYLKLKYYENDINIKKVVEELYISKSVINKIDEFIEKIKEEGIEKYCPDIVSNYNDKKATEIDEDEKNFIAVVRICFGLIGAFIIFCILMSSFIDNYYLNGELVAKEEFDDFDIIFIVVIGIFIIAFIAFVISSVKSYFNLNSTSDQDYENYEIEEESDDFDPIQRR